MGNDGAQTLFAVPGGGETEPPRLADYSRSQRWEAEYSTLGFVPGCHPLVLYEKEIAAGAELYRARKRPVFTEAGGIRDHVGKPVTFLAWPVTGKVEEEFGVATVRVMGVESAHEQARALV